MTEIITQQGPTIDRTSYIGASTVAAICGVDKHRSPFDVACFYKGIFQNEERAAQDAALEEMGNVGNDMERPLIETTYRRRFAPTSIDYPGTVLLNADRRPALGATPDAIVNGERTLQVKCPSPYRFISDFGDEQDGPDGVPESYLVQCTWEMLIGREALGLKGEVAELFAGCGCITKRYELPYDKELAQYARERVEHFVKTYLEGDAMPDPMGSDLQALQAQYPHPRRPVLDATEEQIALAMAYHDVTEQLKELDKAKRDLKAQLQASIGDAEGVKGSGCLVTWKLRKGFKMPAKEVAATRTLRVHIKKGD